MQIAQRAALVLCLVWGLLAAHPLTEDGEDLVVMPLEPSTGKDQIISHKPPTTTSTTSLPEISREERHRQIDEYLRTHRREMGDVVDQWFRSRWSAARWAGID